MDEKERRQTINLIETAMRCAAHRAAVEMTHDARQMLSFLVAADAQHFANSMKIGLNTGTLDRDAITDIIGSIRAAIFGEVAPQEGGNVVPMKRRGA